MVLDSHPSDDAVIVVSATDHHQVADSESQVGEDNHGPEPSGFIRVR